MRQHWNRFVGLTVVAFCLMFSRPSPAGPVEDSQRRLLHGEYQQCIDTAKAGLAQPELIEDCACLKAQAEFVIGRYEDACKTLRTALPRAVGSIRIRWLLVQYLPYTGRAKEADPLKLEIDRLVQSSAWRYSQKDTDLVTLSQIVLSQGADAKQIQTVLLKRARDLHPDSRLPPLTIGQLALEKRDFALASETFRNGLVKFPNDPDFLFGLARAFKEDSPREFNRQLDLLLAQNPRHIGGLLLQAEQLMDGERYASAREKLNEVFKINPSQPVALAYLAVLEFIDGKAELFTKAREQALSSWPENPQVDYELGRKLSEKYRFEDGAAAQRRALVFNFNYLPAKKQLALDMLRLGQEEEGWKVARDAYQQDQYDASVYNLIALQDELVKFTVIERPGWRIRMEKAEANLYGDRVVDLLVQARLQLCEKYDVKLDDTIYVEIFPRPADFAVRTFGMPGAGGYLGVCFGDVITALSPASQGSRPVNWESVLWHEFAHVVTLNKTHNRMPRWLSEGISVYEERQRDPRWGEQMSIAYKQLILDGQLKPISQLSEAFLRPGRGGIMFAYFQSSLAVEHIVNTYGQQALVAILNDLAIGIPINDAIERNTTAMGELEENYAKSAKVQAQYFGWYVDWSPAKFELIVGSEDPIEALKTWAERHPRHYQGLKTCAESLSRLGKKKEAAMILQQAVNVFPFESGLEGALSQLAELQNQLATVEEEHETLQQWARIDAAAATALLRLIDIDSKRQDWPQVQRHALHLLQVKPLIPQPYLALAVASEKLDDPAQAVNALIALLKLNPVDAADVHYRLARQLQELGRTDEAKRHVLQALEFAPRYRDALSLLLEINTDTPQAPDSILR